MTYQQFQRDLPPSPLRGPRAQAFTGGLGSQKDALLREFREAVYAGFPRDATGRGRQAPDAALPYLGADADLERAPGEADADWRGRIADAHDLWGWAGTPYGYGLALHLTSPHLAGFRIVPQYQWSAPPDGLTALWSRFWVYVWTGALAVGRFTIGPWVTIGAAASPWSLLVIGSFTIGDGSTIGSSATRAEVLEIRRALAKWKNARDRVPALVLADGVIIGMPGLAIGAFVIGGSRIELTRALVVGSFVIGARPTDGDVPWFPRLGRAFLV